MKPKIFEAKICLTKNGSDVKKLLNQILFNQNLFGTKIDLEQN